MENNQKKKSNAEMSLKRCETLRNHFKQHQKNIVKHALSRIEEVNISTSEINESIPSNYSFFDKKTIEKTFDEFKMLGFPNEFSKHVEQLKVIKNKHRPQLNYIMNVLSFSLGFTYAMHFGFHIQSWVWNGIELLGGVK